MDQRIYENQGFWYFASREGTRGPFPTQTAAQHSLFSVIAHEQKKGRKRA